MTAIFCQNTSALFFLQIKPRSINVDIIKTQSEKPIPIRLNYGRDFLRKWQLMRLEEAFAEPSAGPTNVTALCYCFGTETWISSHFPFFLSALRETWRCCGMLKTVFVSNVVAQDLAKLRDQYPEWVEIRVVDTLVPEPSPDDIHSMSLDMDAHLAERFDTDYVLVIQDDGFPLRKGLDHFLGRYDFYGSPSRSFTITQFIKGMATGKWLMNGWLFSKNKKMRENGESIVLAILCRQALFHELVRGYLFHTYIAAMSQDVS